MSTALLAIVVASSSSLSPKSACLVCIGFLLFLLGNYEAFKDYLNLRNHLFDMAQMNVLSQVDSHSYCAGNEMVLQLAKLLAPPNEIFLGCLNFKIYYWIMGGISLLCLWFIPQFRRSNNSNDK